MSGQVNASGFIFVNKPTGSSSAHVLNGIKAQFKKGHCFDGSGPGKVFAEPTVKLKNKDKLKIGHTGTLDSFAGGLLICPYGKATAFAESILRLSKTYLAEFYFGRATDTFDPVGKTTHLDRNAWQKLWGDSADMEWTVFTKPFAEQMRYLNGNLAWPPVADGHGAQMPPDFSAKKIGGKRASDLKRAGKEVKLKPKDVEIHTGILGFASRRRLRVGFRVSSGTYIRAIARDWGEALGVPCFVNELMRPQIGFDPPLPAEWTKDIVVAGKERLLPGQFWVWPGYEYLKTVLPGFELTQASPGLENALKHGKKVEIGQTQPCFTFHGSGAPNNLHLVHSQAPESALLWTKDGELALWMEDIQWDSDQIKSYRIKKNFLAV